jgi:hypothetical protein
VRANLTKSSKIEKAIARAEQRKTIIPPDVAARLQYTIEDFKANADAAYLEDGGDNLETLTKN